MIKNLSVSDLEEVQESEKLTTEIRDKISILLLAINDWPDKIVDLLQYEQLIYSLIGKDVDRKNLEEFISNADLSRDAWVIESLCQLLEIYKYHYEQRSLQEILEEVREKIEELR